MKKKMGRLNKQRKVSTDLADKLAAQKKELAARNKRIKELETQVATAANVAAEQARMIRELQEQLEEVGRAPPDMDDNAGAVNGADTVSA